MGLSSILQVFTGALRLILKATVFRFCRSVAGLAGISEVLRRCTVTVLSIRVCVAPTNHPGVLGSFGVVCTQSGRIPERHTFKSFKVNCLVNKEISRWQKIRLWVLKKNKATEMI